MIKSPKINTRQTKAPCDCIARVCTLCLLVQYEFAITVCTFVVSFTPNSRTRCSGQQHIFHTGVSVVGSGSTSDTVSVWPQGQFAGHQDRAQGQIVQGRFPGEDLSDADTIGYYDEVSGITKYVFGQGEYSE